MVLQHSRNQPGRWETPAANSATPHLPFGAAHSLKQHQHLLRLPDQANYLYQIKTGWAGRYRLLSDGRRQITALYLPGDICDVSWQETGHASQSVVALTSVGTMRISRTELEAQLQCDAKIASLLWRQSARAHRIQAEWIFNLGRKNALERLSHLLCEFYSRLARAGGAEGASCEMPLTQQDLADVAGLTPVHVNRTLQEMRALGLIDLQSRRLTIHDLPALQRTGWFDPHYLAD